MTAPLLPLSAAPGLDPVGLFVHAEDADGDPHPAGYHVGRKPFARRLSSFGDLSAFDWADAVIDEHGGLVRVGWLQEPSVSLADAATRDRLERWEPLRTFLHALPEQRVVFLHFRRSAIDRYASAAVFRCLDFLAAGYVDRWVRPDAVPALDALDPSDDARLPDGSRLVDALALAAVARHVGGQGVVS